MMRQWRAIIGLRLRDDDDDPSKLAADGAGDTTRYPAGMKRLQQIEQLTDYECTVWKNMRHENNTLVEQHVYIW